MEVSLLLAERSLLNKCFCGLRKESSRLYHLVLRASCSSVGLRIGPSNSSCTKSHFHLSYSLLGTRVTAVSLMRTKKAVSSICHSILRFTSLTRSKRALVESRGSVPCGRVPLF